MNPLTALIETPEGQTDAGSFRVLLRIENRTGKTAHLLNPRMGIPAPQMNWRRSNEAYQISLLLSFNYLSMSVTDEAGQTPPQIGSDSGGTPAVWPMLELAPRDFMTLTIPLGEFYALESGKTYDVTIEYGEQGQKVTTRGRISVP